ncbi:hypothetical protein LSAT2_032207 [Lamellibrachia satsuma]|nr:hypothetical protein LSAT2_032207 [Lamellibrachia satsuma]
MGRLTDDILAMIGVKPSDRVSAAKTPNNIEIPEIPLMFPTREQIVNGIEEAEKPEDEEDCLSCKVVGCSVLCGAAGAILYAVKRNSPHFTGRKLHLYRAQGGSVAGVLILLAGCRWFNAGVFDKDKADMSLLDQTKADLRKLFLFCNVDPPKMLDTQSKTETDKT